MDACGQHMYRGKEIHQGQGAVVPSAQPAWQARKSCNHEDFNIYIYIYDLPRNKEERYQDAICESTAIASYIDPKSTASSVIAAKVWKGSAKGTVPEVFAICQGYETTNMDGFPMNIWLVVDLPI